MQFDKELGILVTGSKDKTIKITDMNKWRCKETLTGHEGDVYCVQFDATKIISSSGDSTVKIWSLGKGNSKSQLVHTMLGHTGPVSNIQFDSDKIISCSDDQTIKAWDISGKFLRDFEGHRAMIWTVTFQGNTIVSGSHDYTIKIWDDRVPQCAYTLGVHESPVRYLQMRDSTLLSGSNNGKVVATDLRKLGTNQSMDQSTFMEFIVEKRKYTFLNCLKFDERKIVTATESIKIYDWNGNKINHYGATFEMGDVLRVQYDGEEMITAGKTVMEWSLH